MLRAVRSSRFGGLVPVAEWIPPFFQLLFGKASDSLKTQPTNEGCRSFFAHGHCASECSMGMNHLSGLWDHGLPTPWVWSFSMAQSFDFFWPSNPESEHFFRSPGAKCWERTSGEKRPPRQNCGAVARPKRSPRSS